jgi:hypothetical protein
MWCITYVFSFEDIKKITINKLSKDCGSGLECCLVISNFNDGLQITDTSKIWIINHLDLKGTRDSHFEIKCGKL